MNRRLYLRFVLTAALAGLAPSAFAQAPAGRGGGPPQPQVTSPELSADRRITFRILAPQAQAIRLAAGDIPGVGQTTQLIKGENGVWEVTIGPIDPGTYRYNFNVDGVTTIDPRSPFISESNNNVWSLIHVPGSDFADTKNVPHGGVAAVSYYSSALGTFRRMHVYTPPGYERNNDKYPVFYLLHGAGDSDDSWTSVGRAGFILDNLIAAKKAKPMIVVMPAGHTRRGPAGPGAAGRTATEEFVKDFVGDVMPYIEKNYRVLTDRSNTAIAGLSMGGNHALQVGIPQLNRFAYIGVYSSGLLGGAFPGLGGGRRGAAPTATPGAAPAAAPAAATPTGPPPQTAAEWEKEHAANLDNASLKKGLKLFWFATGKDDGLITTTNATVELFKKHGFTPVMKETPGGHTWINWRDYLNEFAPMLFQKEDTMRRIGRWLVVATCAFAVTASAAVYAQPGPSFTSPEVGADRRLTLRYLAPNAKSVVAAGELDGKPHPLTRGDNGVWSVTIGPLAPDIYTYAFNVDGVTALDPLNANTKYGYGRFGAVSVVEVPGDGPQFYDVKPVPHGEVRIRPYVSKTLGVSRTAWVYTPPGYDKGSNFPVLYLLHGAGDIESGWTMIGRANNIIDNAIAEGKAKPMVVVMPLGHAIQSFWTGAAKQAPDPVAKAMAGATLAEIIDSMMGGDGKGGLSPVTRDIVEEVMPMIESTYKVSKRPDDRAIAGLSMGGGHSINISFVRPELFRYVALMSPAAGGGVAKMYPRIAEKPDILNRQFKLFWVGVGKDDTLTGPGDKAFAEALTAIGVKHTFVLTEGRHEWTVWRHYLNDIAPLLFR